MARAARLAPALSRLRNELDRKYPNRDRTSDGWLGDRAHRARRSDHNPNIRRTVNALDVDDDGIDVKALLKEVIGDSRVRYVIYNRVVWYRSYNWKPKRYTGSNPHNGHVHISIKQESAAENNTTAWFTTAKPIPPKVAEKIAQVVLQQGSRGKYVVALQQVLRVKPADGIFGPRTKAAVIRFQRANGIEANGVVGGATIRALQRIS